VSSGDDIRWMVLLKFGQRQHLEEFRRDGLLYMNPQQYFADLEGDLARGDRFEGTDQILQPKDIRHIRIEDNVSGEVVMIRPEDMAGPVSIGLGKRPACNLFCMFAVTKPVDGPFVDERCFGFGESFTLVLNTQEFINRICAAARAAGFGYAHGLVQYYDADGYSGDTGPFRKPLIHAYQQEFRFLLEPGSRQPIRLTAGCLEDITTPIHTLADINRIVDFGTESAGKSGLSW
jgi:hypothetical protein